MNRSLSQNIRRYHRGMGLIFSVFILMSSGSGVLHNVMSRMQPPPPQARPGGPDLDLAQMKTPVSEAFAKLGRPDLKVKAVSIRVIEGAPWYQFLVQGVEKPFYVNAVSAAVGADEDEVYAAQIAREYLGGKSVEKTQYLTAFNQEYLNIFRILPVYRFDARDSLGTRVYVSTMTGSVTRYTDNQKQFEASVFTNIHKFGFIANRDLRDFVLTAATAGAFMVSLGGIVLYVLTIPKKKN